MSLLTAAFARLPRFPPAEAWRTNLPKPPRRRIEPSAPPREAFVDTEAMAAIDALYTGEADRTRKRVNLAQGLVLHAVARAVCAVSGYRGEKADGRGHERGVFQNGLGRLRGRVRADG